MAARRGREDRALPGGNRIPAAEIEELASRASGPGGQHVNTSSTRVSLRWNLRTSIGLTPDGRERLLRKLASRLTSDGVLVVHADRHRSRRRNLEEAHDRLFEVVRTALYQAPARRPTKPRKGAVERRLKEKRRRSAVKRERRHRRDDD